MSQADQREVAVRGGSPRGGGSFPAHPAISRAPLSGLTAGLFAACLVAKSCALVGHIAEWSLALPLAYIWQDCALAVAFALVAAPLRVAPRVLLSVYWLLIAYIAINAPVTRVLSTPLTWPLLRAARGPLSDSILAYLTVENVACVVAVVAAAAIVPRLVARAPSSRLLGSCAPILLLVAVLGGSGRLSADTIGLERNAVGALLQGLAPRVESRRSDHDWRASPFADSSNEDLTELRGLCAGRNVVMIHLESTAAQYLRLHGADRDPMPNLSRIAERGMVFNHAYAVYPESIKGLFSVLCATYPAFDTPAESYARVRPPALPDILRRAGYRTGLFHSGRFMYLGMDEVVRDRGYDTLEDAGAIGGEHESSFGVGEEATLARMLGWIDSLPRNERFLLTYLPIAGHHPYNVPRPGPFAGSEPRDEYLDALHYADRVVGQLWDELRSRGLDRRTLFVLCGDHGEAFEQHVGNIGHTLFVYEENVRVPLVIAAPGALDAQRRIDRVASLIDLAPTVLDLLGLPVPAEWQGGSLLEPRSRMALMFTDYSLGFLSLRDGRWKCIHQLGTESTALFDLVADPAERRNLADGHPERVAAYRRQLLGWCQDQRARILAAMAE